MRVTEHPPEDRKKPGNGKRPSAKNNKMQAYRARLRAAGLRPVQIWVPDLRSPKLAKELRRQSLLAARSKGEKEILDEIESYLDSGDWL